MIQNGILFQANHYINKTPIKYETKNNITRKNRYVRYNKEKDKIKKYK